MKTINASRTSPEPGPIISRFSIVIIAAALLGAEVGHTLPTDTAQFCGLVGLSGIAWFAALELAAQMRNRAKSAALQTSAEVRLQSRVQQESAYSQPAAAGESSERAALS